MIIFSRHKIINIDNHQIIPNIKIIKNMIIIRDLRMSSNLKVNQWCNQCKEELNNNLPIFNPDRTKQMISIRIHQNLINFSNKKDKVVFQNHKYFQYKLDQIWIHNNNIWLLNKSTNRTITIWENIKKKEISLKTIYYRKVSVHKKYKINKLS